MKTANKDKPIDVIFSNLTIFRYPLAIWVVCHHLYDQVFVGLDSNNYFLKISSAGNSAVISFFILSGFVISHAWSRRPNIGYFIKRRILSLFPLFLISILIFAVINKSSAINIFQNILGIQVFSFDNWFTLNGPSWSISVEFLFYFSFPIWLKIINNISRIRQALGAVILIEFCITFLVGNLSSERLSFYILYHFPPFHFLHFVEGMLCYRIVRNSKLNRFQGIVYKLTTQVLFSLSILLTIQVKAYFLKLGIFIVIPTILILLTHSNQLNLNISKARSLWYRAGEATFVIYITHYLWIGLLRKFLAPIDSVPLLILFSFLSLILVTIISSLFQSLVISPIGKLSSFKEFNPRIANSFILLVAITILLFILGSNFKRDWSEQNIPRNQNVESIIESSEVQSNGTRLNLLLTNLSTSPTFVKRCVFLGTYKNGTPIQFIVPIPKAYANLNPSLQSANYVVRVQTLLAVKVSSEIINTGKLYCA